MNLFRYIVNKYPNERKTFFKFIQRENRDSKIVFAKGDRRFYYNQPSHSWTLPLDQFAILYPLSYQNWKLTFILLFLSHQGQFIFAPSSYYQIKMYKYHLQNT